MLVGEAPSGTEMSTGRPFTGGAGTLLEHALSRSGISLSACFQTNVLHTPVPGKAFESILTKQNQIHYIAGVLQLKADIESIRPNIIVPLGTGALQAVTGKKGIDKWRGSILESTLVKGVKAVGSYSPGYALKLYEAKAVMEMDFARVKKQSEFPEIIRPQREYYLAPDADTQSRLVTEMVEAEWLAIDIEMYEDAYGEWHLSCVGFSDRPDRALVLPWNSSLNQIHIKTLCESPRPKKIFQNGQFDTTRLEAYGINVVGYEWDTMYAHHALFAEAASGEDELSMINAKGKKRVSILKKGLAFQTSIYTEEPFYKDDSKIASEIGDIQLFYLYNGRDCCVTREIRDVQERELVEFGSFPAFRTEMEVVPALMYATKRGILIDKDRRQSLKEMYEQEIENLQSFLDTSAGTPINVKSSPQVTKFLYDVLKLPPKYNRKTGNITGDKDAINELAGKFNHPLLLTILKIRERRDYLERYIDIKLGGDGRMRCLFDPSGTRSGRLASRTSLDGTGTNLQTIPSRKAIGELIKQMFIADPGKLFIYPDFKQAEAWLVAYLARCESLIELLNDPTRDVHYENASRIFGKPVADITEEERYLAKRVVHASNYGMGPDKLVILVAQDSESTGVRITYQRAKELMDKYFMVYPEIKSVFWRTIEDEVRYTRTLNTPFHQKRAFFGRMDSSGTLLREAYSYIPQATVGHLGLKASTNAYNRVQLGRPELGAEFLLNVHDSILVQCNEVSYQATADAVLDAMRIPITVYGREFTIPTDCKIGRNWGKKSATNPAGMRDISKGTEGLF
jgi:uracil-DNA glycosylase family 4